MTAEQQRLADARAGTPWRKWGPYLSERQWGTVREDYSEDGAAWDYFTHDQARSRAYRWGEDGLAGFSDDHSRLCFALALWNGADPILKERLFGLTNSEGNHGEDVKEYYYYLDATPTHSYMRWLYKYPQRAFPYSDLVTTNRARGRDELEYELLDTGVFAESRYFDVEVEYAKETAEDIAIRITVHNRGPEAARLHLLPTLWFRNTWSWQVDDRRPRLRAIAGGVEAAHADLGTRWLLVDGGPTMLFTENESNAERLWGQPSASPYVKDAFHRYVVNGDTAAVNPAGSGTKSAALYVLDLPAGGSASVRLRLTDARPARASAKIAAGVDDVIARRRGEADAFYDSLLVPGVGADSRQVFRQALAGMLWSKQHYDFNLDIWLEEHGAHPLRGGKSRAVRNRDWFHMVNDDVISMPDKWEYPWFAAWDLAFHCVALAVVDVDFAKHQLELMLRDLYLHPTGQIPAYEWNFGDVNPPVHAWATLLIYFTEKAATGQGDVTFLRSAFQKLLVNFTWWLNRKDPSGRNVFEGGFLGLDNIGVFDRSAPLPTGGSLDQADGTAWMALFAQNMLEISLELAQHDPDVRRDGAQVRRALPVDRRRHGSRRRQPGRAVGRDRRLLLRRPALSRRFGAAPQDPLDGRPAVPLCDDGDRERRAREISAARRAVALVSRAPPGSVRDHRADHPPRCRRPAPAGRPRRGQAAPHPALPPRRERVPRPPRHPRPLAPPPRSPVRLPMGRRLVERDVRAGRVDVGDCSAATPTGAGRCGCP